MESFPHGNISLVKSECLSSCHKLFTIFGRVSLVREYWRPNLRKLHFIPSIGDHILDQPVVETKNEMIISQNSNCCLVKVKLVMKSYEK